MMESPSPSPQNKSVQGAGRRGRGFPELRHKQLKEQAVAFYSEHKVQDALEGLLNEMFLSDPRDVYGYMSDYFRGLSKDPVISSLSVYEELDSSGEKALNLELYCTVRGKDKLVSNTSLSLEMYDLSVEAQPVPPPPKSPRGTPRNKSPRSRASRGGTPSRKTPVKSNLDPGELTSSHASTASSVPTTVLSAAKTVNDYISPAVKGLSPFLQNEVDTTLAAITTEDGSLHPSALLAASYAAGIAGARLTNTPLYLHLAKTCRPPSPSSQPDTTFKRAPGEACRFTMPLPVVGVLSGGQSGCGKCRFREFCLSPLPGAPFPEQIQMIVAVHKELGKCLTGKYGGSGQGRLLSGSYCPTLDKPEQGLDFIRDAARNAGFELNQGMGVIVDVGADTLYNEEKGKYELIAGQWKSSDDVITIYATLLRSYPGLLGYVDPLHHTDVDGWKKLQERLGDNCLLIADQTLKKGLPISEQKPETILTDTPDDTNPVVLPDKPSVNYLSCGALTLEATISQTLAKATHIKGHSYYVMLRVPPNSTVSTLPADMAVAMMCRFLRMGGPNGLTSCGLLSRLLRIREELVSKKLHDPAGALVFTSIPPGVDTVYE